MHHTRTGLPGCMLADHKPDQTTDHMLALWVASSHNTTPPPKHGSVPKANNHWDPPLSILLTVCEDPVLGAIVTPAVGALVSQVGRAEAAEGVLLNFLVLLGKPIPALDGRGKRAGRPRVSATYCAGYRLWQRTSSREGESLWCWPTRGVAELDEPRWRSPDQLLRSLLRSLTSCTPPGSGPRPSSLAGSWHQWSTC